MRVPDQAIPVMPQAAIAAGCEQPLAVILGQELAGVRITLKNFEVTIRWRLGHGLGSPCGRAPNGLVSGIMPGSAGVGWPGRGGAWIPLIRPGGSGGLPGADLVFGLGCGRTEGRMHFSRPALLIILEEESK